MKRTALVSLTAMLAGVLLSSASLAHDGGRDTCGGHWNAAIGAYEVHDQTKCDACSPLMRYTLQNQGNEAHDVDRNTQLGQTILIPEQGTIVESNNTPIAEAQIRYWLKDSFSRSTCHRRLLTAVPLYPCVRSSKPWAPR